MIRAARGVWPCRVIGGDPRTGPEPGLGTYSGGTPEPGLGTYSGGTPEPGWVRTVARARCLELVKSDGCFLKAYDDFS